MAYEIVVVGSSLGGLNALETILSAMPLTFPLPVVLAQHRGTTQPQLLRSTLQRHSTLRLREPEDKEAVAPGTIYLAPPDYHLMVENRAFALSIDGPVGKARPSIDVLFESAADEYGERTIGVILTGSSIDGARGAAKISQCGGFLIVQDPATAESPILPKAVLALGSPNQVLPLEEITPFLATLCSSEKTA